MNNNRLFLISGFILLICSLAISACKPVEVIATGDAAALAKEQPESLSRASEPVRGETPPDDASLVDRSAYFPSTQGGESSGLVLSPATRNLVMEITRFTDDQWVEMAEIHRQEAAPPAGKTIRYRDDHWAEMAAIHGSNVESPLENFLHFSDDHWEEMEEIHQ